MKPIIRIINGPLDLVKKMIISRLPHDDQQSLGNESFNAIALVNTNIPNVFFFADMAKKAAAVDVSIMSGTCPQHITTLVILGDVSAVRTAIEAIELDTDCHKF